MANRHHEMLNQALSQAARARVFRVDRGGFGELGHTSCRNGPIGDEGIRDEFVSLGGIATRLARKNFQQIKMQPETRKAS
jgi:hypothetical protein